jgi:hypothetical protein
MEGNLLYNAICLLTCANFTAGIFTMRGTLIATSPPLNSPCHTSENAPPVTALVDILTTFPVRSCDAAGNENSNLVCRQRRDVSARFAVRQ